MSVPEALWLSSVPFMFLAVITGLAAITAYEEKPWVIASLICTGIAVTMFLAGVWMGVRL